MAYALKFTVGVMRLTSKQVGKLLIRMTKQTLPRIQEAKAVK
jgi:hypothetical protein